MFAQETNMRQPTAAPSSQIVPIPSAKAARESFRNALQEVRSQNLLAGQSLESVRSYLSLAHRLDVIADDLETCRDQTLSLSLERYWDDYSL
jgi:hypothetical protein